MLNTEFLDSSTKLPTQKEFVQAKLKLLKKSNPIPPAHAAALGMPKKLLELLEAKWQQSDETPKDLNNFVCSLPVHFSGHGHVTLTVCIVDGEVEEICVRANDTLRGIEYDYEFWSADVLEHPATDADKKVLDCIWDEVEFVNTVSTMRATRKQRPNEKCACKSGKKFKKCCGRFG